MEQITRFRYLWSPQPWRPVILQKSFGFGFGVKFWNTLFTVAVQEPCLQANAVPTKGDRLAEPNP